MQSIWSESWKSSEFITTKIAFTSRSVAALQENDLAHRYPPMLSLSTTLGGTFAAVCFRCQSQRNYEFAMDRQSTHEAAYACSSLATDVEFQCPVSEGEI